ncbi:MAG: PSD1 and planctomycete cytochrome C domain-containing protein [Pirellulales bacterium]|nr:PSD1 and planctomycete cytochrome C domain-containing protein [Pirellulales bacterium]
MKSLLPPNSRWAAGFFQHCRLERGTCLIWMFILATVIRAAEPGMTSPSPASPAPQPEAPRFTEAQLEFFETSVRPLLIKHCGECHSHKLAEPEAGLVVDSRAGLLKGGDTGPAIVPGDPAKSLLIDVINYGEIYQMPPKNKLPAEEIAILTKWIADGAAWPEESAPTVPNAPVFDLQARKEAHWCWQPLSTPPPPTIPGASEETDPIDLWIMAKLQERGLAPAALADRRTLIRRAYYDLHGLLPPPERVEAFVADTDPAAWPKLLDELLDSPRFGERWARHWQDLVRYAETYGHEFDFDIHQPWRYRDYLIRAINADVPYDQFAREHIAGDLLEQPRLHPTEGTNESILATAFWFLHEQTHAPVDVRQHEADRIDNMLDVYSKTFLGLTVACARCHDHKFDAISARDYTALTGIMRSTQEGLAIQDPHNANTRAAAMIEQHQQLARKTSLQHWTRLEENHAAKLADALGVAWTLAPDATTEAIDQAALAAKVEPSLVAAWVGAFKSPLTEDPEHPLWFARQIYLHKQAPPPPELPPAETPLQPWEDFSHADFGQWRVLGQAFGQGPTNLGEHWLTQPIPTEKISPPSATEGSLLLAFLPGVADSRRLHPRFQGILRSASFPITGSQIFVRAAGKNAQIRLVVQNYRMDAHQSLLFRGLIQNINNENWHTVTIAGDLNKYVGMTGYLELVDPGDGWLAVDEIRVTPENWAKRAELRSLFSANVEPAELKTIAGWQTRYQRVLRSLVAAARENRLSGQAALAELFITLQSARLLPGELLTDKDLLEQFQRQRLRVEEVLRDVPPTYTVHAAIDAPGRADRILLRGNPKTTGETVPRRFLAALAGEADPHWSPAHCGRLELAQATIDPANPLFSRTAVNRIWQQLFVIGIFPTVDNAGVLGQPPTHPELLDVLARDFAQDGYSRKRLIRRIMLTQAYQRGSVPVAAAQAADPQNTYLHAQRPRRLAGEVIHDTLLQLSGYLSTAEYGPPMPVHLTEFMTGRGRPGESGPLDAKGRRSIYVAIRRNFLSPLNLAFDTPVPFSTVGRRNISNVPAQALILMNDPFVKQQAERWALRLTQRLPENEEARIQRMFAEIFGRPATAPEVTLAQEFLARQVAVYQEAKTEKPQIQAWNDLCHAVINMKEYLYVP